MKFAPTSCRSIRYHRFPCRRQLRQTGPFPPVATIILSAKGECRPHQRRWQREHAPAAGPVKRRRQTLDLGESRERLRTVRRSVPSDSGAVRLTSSSSRRTENGGQVIAVCRSKKERQHSTAQIDGPIM
jgi:hypothetical protein